MAKTNLQVVTVTSAPEALAVLNEQIKSYKHIQDSVYKTPTKGSLRLSDGSTVDLKSETSIDKVVMAFASVQSRIKAIESAYSELGREEYPVVKIEGGTEEEWKQDCMLRIQIIEQKDKLDELNELKKEWEELLDKEDRKAILMKKMANKGLV
jgi:hypothetical protein